LSSSATLTNSGALTLNADDTITSYISNGGTLTAGPGTLFSTSAALNDGSTVAGLLNAGTLTSNGTVLLSGTATAGSAFIQTGALSLTGTLAGDTVNISGGASLLNQNGGLSSSATLTNAGALTLNADDTITSYISNGGTLTAGPGTLFSTTAALNDGSTVAGLLNAATLTSNGKVLLSGTATAGSASIQTGALSLTGTLAGDTVNISGGASLLNQNGGLSASATLTNAGSLTLNADDTITSYISNGGTLTAGPGTLFSNSAALNDGSTVAGLLNAATLTSNGKVLLSGTATAGSAFIQTGALSLTGTLAGDTVNISGGASLLNQNGGLSSSATLTNSGALTLNADDTITSYISNGGTLTAGPGTLFSTTAALNDGSTVAGKIYAPQITSNGAVTISGIAAGKSTTSVQSGTLTLTGTLTTTDLNIASGATLIQNGIIGPSSLGAAVTAVINEGSLVVLESATFKTYTSNGGLLDIQGGRMITQTVVLNDGSVTKGGPFSTNLLTTNGAVRIENSALGARAIVASGVLDLVGSLGPNDVEIASGASLLDQNGGLSGKATLANAGSLTLSSDDTITDYISNGGTLATGAGTLFANSAALNEGSTLAGLLDTTTFTSDGAVLLSGTATAGKASIQSGMLSLSGTLASDAVSIFNGAILLNQDGGLSGSATITNAGDLTMNANDTVASYISNGGTLTDGPGTLHSTSASLNDGSTVAGRLYSDFITSNGAVTISGIANGKDTTSVQSGTLNLTGTLTTTNLDIASGATLIQNGIIGPDNPTSAVTVVTNEGSLIVRENTVFKTYISNGGLLDIQGGKTGIRTVVLNDGSITKGGSFGAEVITANGAVRIENEALSTRTAVASGVLDLVGSLGADNVEIANGASLLNQNGGLSGSATLTNAGSLTLNADDTITKYISNGGNLTAGPGELFSTGTALNDGSAVAGRLDTASLISNGAVNISGAVSADTVNVSTGMLTNTGALGNVSTLLNINGGAALAAFGTQQYSLLTTSGARAGTWLGDLDNTSTVAPGGMGATGVLAIRGDFSQSAGGTLTLDLSAMESDRLDITGNARFNGSLVLNQVGSAAIAPFVPITVVSAAGYAGNITSLSENLDGAVWFNPGNGTVTRLDLPSGDTSFFGATSNQTSTWISLYDDVIEPGIANITSGPGGYDITSGLADAGNPDLLWALSASFTPAGLNAALLNRLSPEVYGGLSDYAMQATRAHQRSALSAPALDPMDDSKGGMASGAKGGAKGGIADTGALLDWEFFAAVDFFRAGTDNSRNQADYDFEGMGVLTGARTRLQDQLQLAVYLGADSGTISGELIDADALGWNFGVIGEYLLDEKSRTRLTAGISYGSYAFDGSRGSASATAAGWRPGEVGFDDMDVDAVDLFVGLDGVAWKQDALTLIPSAGLRYAMSRMDAFDESTGGTAGSPIALNVSRDRHESLLLELGLMAQVAVNDKTSLWGEGGINLGLHGDGRVLGASFAEGGRPMRAGADGLGDDSIYLGWGAVYQITEDVQAGLGYRADIRSGVEAQQELRISSSWRF
jgi:cytoskeletal protein CcmA (bactofilin family)